LFDHANSLFDSANVGEPQSPPPVLGVVVVQAQVA
jgi:hypothetical protein